MDVRTDLSTKIVEATVPNELDLAPLARMNVLMEVSTKIAEVTIPAEVELAPYMAKSFVQGGKQTKIELDTFETDDKLFFPSILKGIAITSPFILQILSTTNNYFFNENNVLRIFDKLKRKENENQFLKDCPIIFKNLVEKFLSELTASGLSEEQSYSIISKTLVTLLKDPSTSLLFIEELQNRSNNLPEDEKAVSAVNQSINLSDDEKIISTVNQSNNLPGNEKIVSTIYHKTVNGFGYLMNNLNETISPGRILSRFFFNDNTFQSGQTLTNYGKYESLPPWLWIWLISFVYSIPSLIGKLNRNFSSLPPPVFIYSYTTFVSYLFLLPKISEAVLCLILFLGVLTVAFPQVRKSYIEKKYNLSEDYPRIPAVVEIEEFLETHAPNIKIKANLLFQSETVFTYPVGYRTTGIAIFGKLIKSWRVDRSATEAILLHQIGHQRNGDSLIFGISVFFGLAAKYLKIMTVLLFSSIALVFVITCVTCLCEVFKTLYDAVSVTNLMNSSASEVASYILESSLSIVYSQITQLILLILEIMILLLLLFSQAASIFALPIIGIWAAELNADRFMATSKSNSMDNSLKVIAKLRNITSLKQWSLSQIIRPPNSLRQWMTIHSHEKKSVLFYLFLYPMGYIFQLIMTFLYIVLSYIIYHLSGSQVILEISERISDIYSMMYLCISLSVVYLLWPFISVYWVKFFSGVQERYNLENYVLYFLFALISALISLIFYFGPIVR